MWSERDRWSASVAGEGVPPDTGAGSHPRRVIVSADDFGLSPGVNAGIIDAHTHGILTNASLMVNGAAFAQAVELARRNPSLGVGLHLVLAQGRAACEHRQIPGLVDAEGMFRNNAVVVGFRYFFTPGLRAQLRLEIRAQLDKFRSTGLPLSHVDGHLNIHMHPTVLAILLDIAAEYGIRALRLPREPLAISLGLDSTERVRKTAESITFRALAAYNAPRIAARDVRVVDQMFGLHQSGHMTERYLLGLIARLPPGVTEIYTHASIVDAEARRWRPLTYECEGELAALKSPHVREALDRAGVRCIRYDELG